MVSRVSGKPVNSMEEFSRVLVGNEWALFRSSEDKKTASEVTTVVCSESRIRIEFERRR